MPFSSDVRSAGPWLICALLLTLLAGPVAAEPVEQPDDEITLGDEPLDLSTPLLDSARARRRSARLRPHRWNGRWKPSWA